MARTLGEVKKETDAKFQAGAWNLALQDYYKLALWAPEDVGIRFKIAHCLFEMGEREAARQVYHALGLYCLKEGMPLRALVAARRVALIAPERTELFDAIAGIYASGSDRIRRGALPKQPEFPAKRLVPAHAMEPLETEDLVRRATAIAQTIEDDSTPEVLPEIPLLSLLHEDALVSVAQTVRERVLSHGAMVLREGDQGDSFFIIVEGTVRVLRSDGFGGEVNLANLTAGTVFGEMALVSASPRTASAQVHYEATLLEFSRDSLRAAAEELEAVALGLAKFCRDRLLRNLLGTAQIFKPFDKRQRMGLIKQFTGHDVSAGTVIIKEGEQGKGLFLILSGECDVSKIDGGERVLLATLHAGDPIGEMSLIRDQPTSATVVAASDSTLLFLDRELFRGLVDAVPDFRDYFEQLVEERELDTQLTMDDDDETELTDDDIILI